MKNHKRHPRILVIHGPNLNMLGKREPETYGHTTLEEVNSELEKLGKSMGVAVETFQSNHEGDIIDRIQQAIGTCAGLIINPAAYTHTSIAIRDALLLLDMPIIEVHISDISKRESFRHASMITDISTDQVVGQGVRGYSIALETIAKLIAYPHIAI
jgi:3-dehydroquinate dehydratase-2